MDLGRRQEGGGWPSKGRRVRIDLTFIGREREHHEKNEMNKTS